MMAKGNLAKGQHPEEGQDQKESVKSRMGIVKGAMRPGQPRPTKQVASNMLNSD